MVYWNWKTEEEFLPSGHQAPKLSLILTSHNIITSTGLNLINCKHIHYSPSSTLLLCVHTRYNLFAHSLAHPCFLLIFINPQYTVLHILSHCTSYSFYFIICSLFHSRLYLYIYSLVLCFIVLLLMLFLFYFLFYHYYYFFFALSIERTCPDLHFTTDYTLYDCVCDK